VPYKTECTLVGYKSYYHKNARSNTYQRSCYWRFLIMRVSYTTSTFPTGKQLTRHSTWRSCDVCVNQFAEKDRKNGDWILHHDNAPAHTSHLVQQFLAKHGTAQLQQRPYSPDLAPCDSFLFPRLKKVLKRHRCEATEDIKRNSTKTLLDIPKEEFARCFQQWQKRWQSV
jgi:transposase